jgi:hypothetical protein
MGPEVSYEIVMATIGTATFPKTHRVVKIDGVEVARQEAGFKEIQIINPELGLEYAILYKQFLLNFVNSIEPSLGFLGLTEESLTDFSRGIYYAAGNSAVTIQDSYPIQDGF